MYAEFLRLALDRAADGELAASEALITLIQRGDSLDEPFPGEGGTLGLLADELNHDVALIVLARSLGVDVDVQAFDQPWTERSRLEQAIESYGIELYLTDGASADNSGRRTST